MLQATTVEAYAALWRHLLDVDLIARVTAERRPLDEPLRFLLADSRQPKTTVADGIWLRLVDVQAALAGRRYAREGRLLLQVTRFVLPLERWPLRAGWRPGGRGMQTGER